MKPELLASIIRKSRVYLIHCIDALMSSSIEPVEKEINGSKTVEWEMLKVHDVLHKVRAASWAARSLDWTRVSNAIGFLLQILHGLWHLSTEKVQARLHWACH